MEEFKKTLKELEDKQEKAEALQKQKHAKKMRNYIIAETTEKMIEGCVIILYSQK